MNQMSLMTITEMHLLFRKTPHFLNVKHQKSENNCRIILNDMIVFLVSVNAADIPFLLHV